jgi:predicted nucleic acid-binding protein
LSRFVLDTSVSLAWFLDRPVPPHAVQVWNSLKQGSRAVVPPLWLLEMANGFATADRRGALARSDIDRCLTDVDALLASSIEYSTTAISFRQAFASASGFRLTAYDAVYLETARTEHLPIATLDRALADAARKAGVRLFV